MIYYILKKILHLVKRELNRSKPSKKSGLSLKQIRKLNKLPKLTKSTIKWFDRQISFSDASSFLHTIDEIFEKEIYHFKTETTRPYIIDVGSNIGLSVLFFKRLYPNSEIVAFEPDPEIFEMLKSNLNDFEVSSVVIHNAAVWKTDGEQYFYSEGALSGSLEEIIGANKIRIQTKDIINLINNHEVELLKIDVEGSELEILLHLKPYLKFVKRIFVEYHNKQNNTQELHSLLNLLNELGYFYYIKQETDPIERPFTDKHIKGWNFSFQLNIFAYR